MNYLSQTLPVDGRARQTAWAIAIVAAALAVGAATAVSPDMGIATVILIGAGLAWAVRPATVMEILLIAVFLDAITLGGVAITRIIAPIGLFVVVLELAAGRATFRLGLPFVAVAGYSTWALASGLWSVDQERTVYMLLSLVIALVYMFAVATLISTERDLERAVLVLAVTAMAVGTSSVASFAHLPGGIGTLQEGRAQGGLSDPNYFAALQLVVLPLIVVSAAQAESVRMRRFLYASAFIVIGSILTTVSRGGIMALIVVLIAMIALPVGTLFPSGRHKLAIMLVLVMALGVFLSRPYLRYELTDRLLAVVAPSSSEGADTSGAGRTELWKAARHAVKENPLTGIGYGAFYSQAPRLLRETPGVELDKVNVEVKEVHNAYLGTAAELGVPGLTFFLGLIVLTWVTLRDISKRARARGSVNLARLANALVLSLLGWSFASLFMEAETTRTIWVIIGLSLALGKLVPRTQRPQPLYRSEIST